MIRNHGRFSVNDVLALKRHPVTQHRQQAVLVTGPGSAGLQVEIAAENALGVGHILSGRHLLEKAGA